MSRLNHLAALVVARGNAQAMRRHAVAVGQPERAHVLAVLEVELAEQLGQASRIEAVQARRLVERDEAALDCEDCRQPWRQCACPPEPEMGCDLCDQRIPYTQCTCAPVESDPPEPVDFSSCNWRWNR